MTLLAIVIPPLGLIIAAVGLWGVALSWVDVAVFLTLYVLTGLGTTVGYHRLFTHRSFETTKTVRATFAILGSMTIQGPVTQWVTDHRKHHALSDQDGDPHSPHAGFAPNAWGALKGFFHAHMGWLFHLKGMERGDHYGKDLYDDRLIRGIDRMYFVWVTLSFALPFAVGYAVGGASWKLGLEVLVWGGLIRVFAYQHATFSVNSICHMFGRPQLPLARREPQQLGRRGADLRRGLAQQPPRLPGLGPARPRPPSARHRLDHDPDAREARPRLERAPAERDPARAAPARAERASAFSA